MTNPRARGEASRRVDGQAAIGRDRAGAKRQGRHMPFAYRTETENEAQAAFWCVRLIGVRYDAWIEQGRGFERIFAEKISADQLALGFCKDPMLCEGFLHLIGASLELLQQVTMSTKEIIEDIRELRGNGLGIECKNPVDDVIGAHLVGGVEITGLGGRLERAHDDPRRIRPKTKRLSVQERGL